MTSGPVHPINRLLAGAPTTDAEVRVDRVRRVGRSLHLVDVDHALALLDWSKVGDDDDALRRELVELVDRTPSLSGSGSDVINADMRARVRPPASDDDGRRS